MPKFATESKWLKHTDLEDGRDHIVTVERVSQQNLAAPGQPEQKRWVVYFQEYDKGLGLNATNGKTLCKLFGTEEMDEWVGRQCTLYVKDDVEFQGDIVSAIRIRPTSPKKATAKQAKNNQTADLLMDKADAAQSIDECLGLLRDVAIADISEADRKSLTVLINNRMMELKS